MTEIDIRHIFISEGHGFIGQQAEAAGTHRMNSVQSVECVAGSGLKGDRFFDYKPDYKGQATFFSEEVLEGVFDHTGNVTRRPWAMRRNIMVSGIDLNTLVGQEFEIDGIRFLGTEECAPCQWMDRSIGEGAREYLKGNGGLRVKILSSGTLRCGPARVSLAKAQ